MRIQGKSKNVTEKKDYFSRVYELETVDETLALYSKWAKTYAEDITAGGYMTPKRCAEALACHTSDLTIPVLDVGCGTGISGAALRDAGFSDVSGTDVNAEMLAEATRLGIYRTQWLSDLDDPFPFETGTYGAIAAIGVVGSGAAPLSYLHAFLEKLGPGDLTTFSFNDYTLKQPEFGNAVAELVDSGAFVLLHKEYGPHLIGKNMKATVYVLRKT